MGINGHIALPLRDGVAEALDRGLIVIHGQEFSRLSDVRRYLSTISEEARRDFAAAIEQTLNDSGGRYAIQSEWSDI